MITWPISSARFSQLGYHGVRLPGRAHGAVGDFGGFRGVLGISRMLALISSVAVATVCNPRLTCSVAVDTALACAEVSSELALICWLTAENSSLALATFWELSAMDWITSFRLACIWLMAVVRSPNSSSLLYFRLLHAQIARGNGFRLRKNRGGGAGDFTAQEDGNAHAHQERQSHRNSHGPLCRGVRRIQFLLVFLRIFLEGVHHVREHLYIAVDQRSDIIRIIISGPEDRVFASIGRLVHGALHVLPHLRQILLQRRISVTIQLQAPLGRELAQRAELLSITSHASSNNCCALALLAGSVPAKIPCGALLPV